MSPRHYRDSKGCPRDSNWACSVALLLLLLKASVPRLPGARLHHSTSVEIIPLSSLMYAKSPQSCLTLCDPMDCSPPGSSARGILQARTLEYIAIPSSGDLFNPGIEHGSPALQADSLLSEPQGKKPAEALTSQIRLANKKCRRGTMSWGSYWRSDRGVLPR